MHARLKLGVVVVFVLSGALCLAGCGVRGPLEAPGGDMPKETGNATPGTPGTPVPHRPSVLDPLIR
jgi:predicted small lipoprotein YifL